MKRTYTVVLRPEPEGGFTVWVPALRGCITCGDDMREALLMAQDALECYLLSMLDDGETPPKEGKQVVLDRDEALGALFMFRVTVDLTKAAAKDKKQQAITEAIVEEGLAEIVLARVAAKGKKIPLAEIKRRFGLWD